MSALCHTTNSHGEYSLFGHAPTGADADTEFGAMSPIEPTDDALETWATIDITESVPADAEELVVGASEWARTELWERATKALPGLMAELEAEALINAIIQEPANEEGWEFGSWLEVQCADVCSAKDALVCRVLAAVKEIVVEDADPTHFMKTFADDDKEELREAIDILMGWLPVFRTGVVPDAFWAC